MKSMPPGPMRPMMRQRRAMRCKARSSIISLLRARRLAPRPKASAPAFLAYVRGRAIAAAPAQGPPGLSTPYFLAFAFLDAEAALDEELAPATLERKQDFHGARYRHAPRSARRRRARLDAIAAAPLFDSRRRPRAARAGISTLAGRRAARAADMVPSARCR